MISPTMKASFTPETDQWIPWEIAYSLKEYSRDGRTSRSNAILAVVLPDRNNSFSYYLQDKTCCASRCRMHQTHTLFQILRENMFNIKAPSQIPCSNGSRVFNGESSYIPSVRWDEFKTNVNGCLDRVLRINENKNAYEIVKIVK